MEAMKVEIEEKIQGKEKRKQRKVVQSLQAVKRIVEEEKVRMQKMK